MLSGLYLITDDNQDGQLLAKVKAGLAGGARTVQYRAKETTPDTRVSVARQLRTICDEYDARLIINDLPELAREVNADGVHLGQDDMPAAQARQIVGRDKLIGISTSNVEEALKAESQGADYVAIGSIFATTSKDNFDLVGLKALSRVRKAVRIPVVAIGGITPPGAFECITAGADAVAVISGVMADDDPARAAKEYALLFNRGQAYPTGRVLTIAGSDSGGGSGVQADIKTITLLGSYASSVITSLAAQNTLGVSGNYSVHTDFVTKQLEAVLDDIGTDIVKTGMLSWGGIVTRVARIIASQSLLAIVDPVLFDDEGAPLLDRVAQNSFISRLLPQSYLLTPNLTEVEALTGIAAQNPEEMVEAGRQLQELGARNVLIKGGHLSSEATDVLLLGEEVQYLEAPRHQTPNTLGSGSTLSAAIATFLAQGYPLQKAVEKAKRFISLAIETTTQLGHGHGPVNHIQAAMRVLHEEAALD